MRKTALCLKYLRAHTAEMRFLRTLSDAPGWAYIRNEEDVRRGLGTQPIRERAIS